MIPPRGDVLTESVEKKEKRHGRKSGLIAKKRTFEHPQIVLVGQPNCGKSTLFNEVAGYRSVASNFPGATVTYTRSHVRVLDRTADIVDLPGIYSLTSLDPAASEGQRYLLTHRVDVIINVVDSSILSRGLELTLQLLDLEIPLVLCLNMTDEAERKGIRIDVEALSRELGIPVVATVASRGLGVRELFNTALSAMRSPHPGRHLRFSRDVERIIGRLSRELKEKAGEDLPFSRHLLATKLLEGDAAFLELLHERYPGLIPRVETGARELALSHGRSAHEVINAERHAISMSLFERVAVVRKPVLHLKDRADSLLMHPLWGYVFLCLILGGFFYLVFKLGGLAEAPVLSLFEQLKTSLTARIPSGTLARALAGSLIDGLAGGTAIVLPYLLPFLIGLSLLEDAGYLPRVAFLMDTFMHRIGLHGTAVIPAVLGYGCNVPAVMATRILESPRDRFIATFVATLVPCAARMTIIFGLVGYYLGGLAAFAIYLINLAVIGLSGNLLSRLLPADTPGMIIEIPVYHAPRLRSVAAKTWFRIREFVYIALPLLLAGSLILTLVDHLNWSDLINGLTRPVTVLLGLPPEVGLTLIFGILRKELSMLMLFQALGTRDVISVLSAGQIWVFTIFVVFYVPCLATIGALYRQLGAKRTLFVVLYTFVIALMLGLAARGLAAVL
ncbi:MAG TPA: ferrous iron transport protein B [bacterium]|nr:ferrous iron transport protein B [bacterium]